jgi:hypothetical protein
VAGDVVEHARPLAVLVGDRLLHNSRSGVSRTCERGVHIGHAHLQQLRHNNRCRCPLVTGGFGHDNSAVRSDAQLRAMRIADADSVFEPNRRLKPSTAARTSG